MSILNNILNQLGLAAKSFKFLNFKFLKVSYRSVTGHYNYYHFLRHA